MPKKTGSETPSRDLSRLEREVMQVLWQEGKASAKQVKESLDPTKPLALSTILTVLSRLKTKGYVREVPRLGRSIVFQATVPKASIARKTIKSVVKNFFSGSPSALMAHLLKNENLSEGELREIRRMLEEKVRKGGKKKCP